MKFVYAWKQMKYSLQPDFWQTKRFRMFPYPIGRLDVYRLKDFFPENMQQPDLPGYHYSAYPPDALTLLPVYLLPVCLHLHTKYTVSLPESLPKPAVQTVFHLFPGSDTLSCPLQYG